jgi:8-oxo-dGTP pyrophosphatase MutT (NUDIX family)
MDDRGDAVIARLRAGLMAGCQRPVVEQDVDEGELIQAAVLIPVVLHPQPTVLLTKRTDHLRDHPGQISFPGGRVEDSDDSPVMTALREAQEEIGIDPASVDILGCLADYCTVTGFRIVPVVALITPPVVPVLDAFEVAEVFEVPLSFVLDPQNHQSHEVDYRGLRRRYLAIPYQDRFIWGATAGMLHNLAQRTA